MYLIVEQEATGCRIMGCVPKIKSASQAAVSGDLKSCLAHSMRCLVPFKEKAAENRHS